MHSSWKLHLVACALLAASVQAEAPASETTPAIETATFSMYCYWTGEATLGRVDGVVASRIGHWGGAEIVQVDYDPQRTDLVDLVRALKRQRSFYSVLVADATGRDGVRELEINKVDVRGGQPHFIEPKHSLRTRYPKLAALDLSEQQAIALNSWSYFGGKMPDVLDAEQKRRLGGTNSE
jgi:hypothetical protein